VSQNSQLFKPQPRLFRIGRDIPPKRDLYRFVRWPRYIRLQRQKSILKKRLKVPPAINQFTKALEKTQAKELFRLLRHYRPESKAEKKERLKKVAASTLQEEKDGKKEAKDKKDKKEKEKEKAKRPVVLKYGLNHVTSLVESKKAKFVVIAHDIDPLELVIWLPALCRRQGIPYVIVKGKSRLGHLVHHKTASVVALTEWRKDHDTAFNGQISTANLQFNNNVRARTDWGGGIMGSKFEARKKKEDKARESEVVKAAKK